MCLAVKTKEFSNGKGESPSFFLGGKPKCAHMVRGIKAI